MALTFEKILRESVSNPEAKMQISERVEKPKRKLKASGNTKPHKNKNMRKSLEKTRLIAAYKRALRRVRVEKLIKGINERGIARKVLRENRIEVHIPNQKIGNVLNNRSVYIKRSQMAKAKTQRKSLFFKF